MGSVGRGRKGGNPDLKTAREKLTQGQLVENGRKGGLKQGENLKKKHLIYPFKFAIGR